MDYKKIILKPVGIALIFIALLSAGILILKNDIANRADAYNKMQAELIYNSNATKDIVYLQEDAKKAQEYMPALDNYLVMKDQLIDLSKDINSIAQPNKLSFTVNIGAETVPTGSQPRKTDVSLSAQTSGTLGNFVGFLKAIENSNYLINFTSADVVQSNNQLRINMGGKVFTL